MNNLSSSRILVVDDTETNIDILVDFLGKYYTVSVAMDGETALREATRYPPDLILLDIMMPGMDGFEVCKQLKMNPELKEIPVIFLTAMAQHEDIVKGLELGAMDYVTKPFHKDELLLRVKTHLELKLSRETILRQNSENKELVHVLCHDLTNPIGFIDGILQLSETKPDIFTQKKDLIQIAVQNSLNVIELVRKIRAVEDHKINLELSMVNLKQAISESITMLHEKLEKKDIKPVINIEENITVYVEKTSFFSSVLNNIFTNAIKFSYPNSDIAIEACQTGQLVNINIKDTGMGMPESLLNDIFDVSKTTSREGTGGETGTGFGMPLIKKFITAYGGKIEIFSKEKTDHSSDHGTRVSLVLNACQ